MALDYERMEPHNLYIYLKGGVVIALNTDDAAKKRRMTLAMDAVLRRNESIQQFLSFGPGDTGGVLLQEIAGYLWLKASEDETSLSVMKRMETRMAEHVDRCEQERDEE